MEGTASNQNLFSEFEPVSPEAWKARIVADLKGADYDKSLTRSTYEGIRTKPFYTAEDAGALPFAEAAPGIFPYARGKHTARNQWFNAPLIDTAQGSDSALAKAKMALAGGADALEFKVDVAKNISAEELIKAIDLTKTPVQFYLTSASLAFAQNLLQALEEKEIPQEELQCQFFYDPLTENLASGNQTTELEQLLLQGQNNSDLLAINVNGAAFYNKGANLVQELAFTLSAATEYAHRLTEAGNGPEEVLQGASFRMAVGTNYFMEIAKLRALRLLWSAVVKSYNIAPEAAATLTIQSVSASWHQTLLDPHTNILRATTEAMAAIIGGCDYLTILPYDSETSTSSDFPNRIARNISTILKEESYFGNAIDAAAGSYYIEKLTAELAEKAWALFTELETQGGYLQALKTGLIETKIAESRDAKKAGLAKRKEQLTGTNQFAAPATHITGKELENVEATAGNRASSAFDLLRLRMAKYVQQQGKTPKANLVLFGASSMRKARADFAQDFFALAGFEAIRTDVKENIEQLEEIEACALLVLCAADEDYHQYLDTIAANLKAIGKCNLIMVAGNPANLPAGTNLSGVDGFVYMGADAIEVLTTVQMRLGIV